MGQEASIGRPGAPEHHMFLSRQSGKYLQVLWNDTVGTKHGGKPNVFARFLLHPPPAPADAAAPPLPADALQLQVVGTEGDDAVGGSFLTCTANGNVVGGPGGTPNALWMIAPASAAAPAPGQRLAPAACVTIRSLYLNQYLTVVAVGAVRLSPRPETPASLFAASSEAVPPTRLRLMRGVARAIVGGVTAVLPSLATPAEDHPPSVLGPEHVAQYRRDGYIVCRGLLAEGLIAAARHKIDEGLALGVDRSRLLGIGKERQRWTAEYRSSDEVLALCNRSPLLRTAEALLGGEPVAPAREGQIALRKPTAEGKDFALDLDWHIDAYDKTLTSARFGVLAVCALSSWDRDDMGNFTVYPASHLKVASLMENQSWAEWNRTVRESRDLGIAPLQVHASRGDVIFAHPLLAHDVAANRSDQVRWATIFRVKAVEQSRVRKEKLLNPAADLPAAVAPPARPPPPPQHRP